MEFCSNGYSYRCILQIFIVEKHQRCAQTKTLYHRTLQPFHYYITDSVSYYKPPEEGDKSAFWRSSDVTNVNTNQTISYR